MGNRLHLHLPITPTLLFQISGFLIAFLFIYLFVFQVVLISYKLVETVIYIMLYVFFFSKDEGLVTFYYVLLALINS